MALAMIEGAEHDGLLAPGDDRRRVHRREHRAGARTRLPREGLSDSQIVIADCFSEERLQLMRALGAELDVIPGVEGPGRVTAQDIANMVERAAELAHEPETYATDQFNNPYTIPGHREQLGREVWEQQQGAWTGVLPGHRHRELADRRLGGAEGTGRAAVRIVGSRARELRLRSPAARAGRSRCRAGAGLCAASVRLGRMSTRCGRSMTTRRSP